MFTFGRLAVVFYFVRSTKRGKCKALYESGKEGKFVRTEESAKHFASLAKKENSCEQRKVQRTLRVWQRRKIRANRGKRKALYESGFETNLIF